MATASHTNPVLPNLIYDMVTILHSKGEGLQAYDKYMKDARDVNSQPCIDLLQRCKQQDEAMVMEVRDHLSQLLQNGSMPGAAKSGQSKNMGQSSSRVTQ